MSWSIFDDGLVWVLLLVILVPAPALAHGQVTRLSKTAGSYDVIFVTYTTFFPGEELALAFNATYRSNGSRAPRANASTEFTYYDGDGEVLGVQEGNLSARSGYLHTLAKIPNASRRVDFTLHLQNASVTFTQEPTVRSDPPEESKTEKQPEATPLPAWSAVLAVAAVGLLARRPRP